MNSRLVIGAVSLCLFSCKSEEPASSENETPEPEKTHPGDWMPDEAHLVAGRKVYQAECSLCHDEGEEGAPRLANAAEWSEREKKGLAVLINHAINGFNGEDGEMPARGGTETLTDEEVTNAVKFMIAAPK